MPEIFTRQHPGDRITARRINRLARVAEQTSQIKGGANVSTAHANDKQLVGPPRFVQRVVEVTGEDSNGLKLIKVRYHSPGDDSWKSLSKEWKLDDSDLESPVAVGDKITAWWDPQRGTFLPVVLEKPSPLPMTMFFSDDNTLHRDLQTESGEGANFPFFLASIAHSRNGIDNWRAVGVRFFDGYGSHHHNLYGFFHFVFEKTSFIRIVYQAVTDISLGDLRPRRTALQLRGLCPDPGLSPSFPLQKIELNEEWHVTKFSNMRAIQQWQEGPKIAPDDSQIEFSIHSDGKSIKIAAPGEELWLAYIEFEMVVDYTLPSV